MPYCLKYFDENFASIYLLKTHVPGFFQTLSPAGNPKNRKLQINVINVFLRFLRLVAGEKIWKKSETHIFSEDTSIKKRLRSAAAFKKKLQPFYRNILQAKGHFYYLNGGYPFLQKSQLLLTFTTPAHLSSNISQVEISSPLRLCMHLNIKNVHHFYRSSRCANWKVNNRVERKSTWRWRWAKSFLQIRKMKCASSSNHDEWSDNRGILPRKFNVKTKLATQTRFSTSSTLLAEIFIFLISVKSSSLVHNFTRDRIMSRFF